MTFDLKRSDRRIWLIGGTQESAQIAAVLARAHLPFAVTVAAPGAAALYPFLERSQIHAGRLAPEAMLKFARRHQIGAILDASHPYAIEVSRQAIAISQSETLPYLRFERERVASDGAIVLPDFATLLQGDYLTGKRVLLTVGCQPLPQFLPWQTRATLFARVLPAIQSIEAAIAAGFTSDRLLALRPPTSAELERAICHHWGIEAIVTKASGRAGGEDCKRQVAAELGIAAIVVDRPPVAYPQQTSDFDRVLAFCQQSLSLEN